MLPTAAPRPEASPPSTEVHLASGLGGTLRQAPWPFLRCGRLSEALFCDFLKLPGGQQGSPHFIPLPGLWRSPRTPRARAPESPGPVPSLPLRALRGSCGVSPIPARLSACSGARFTFPSHVSLIREFNPRWVDYALHFQKTANCSLTSQKPPLEHIQRWEPGAGLHVKCICVCC